MASQIYANGNTVALTSCAQLVLRFAAFPFLAEHLNHLCFKSADIVLMQESSQPSTSGRKSQESVWTAVINFERQGKADAGEGEAISGSKKAARYIVDVLANCAEDTLPGRGPKR